MSKAQTPQAIRGTQDMLGEQAERFDHVVRAWRGEIVPITGAADAIANMTVIDAIRSAWSPPLGEQEPHMNKLAGVVGSSPGSPD